VLPPVEVVPPHAARRLPPARTAAVPARNSRRLRDFFPFSVSSISSFSLKIVYTNDVLTKDHYDNNCEYFLAFK
jgi:hypothetical protein